MGGVSGIDVVMGVLYNIFLFGVCSGDKAA